MTDLTYSASVMCANLARLEDDFKTLEKAGCDELHFDITDGLFVPNFTFGFELIRAARGCCRLPCYAHLMIAAPGQYIERFVEAGCTGVTVHIETGAHIHRVLTQIGEAGAAPGIAINPATPLTKLDYVLDCVDRILVMTVDPGHAGQKLIPGAYERVSIVKENIEYRKLKAKIEVDGNIDVKNAAVMANRGANILTLGTASIFSGDADLAKAFRAFKSAVAAERNVI